MMRQILILLIILVIFFLGLFFLLPSHKCSDETADSQLEALIKNAEKGDEVAISALIDLNKKDGIEPLAEHWVLTGALFGSKQLCKEYLVKYSGFNQDKKLRLFEVVTNEKEMIGANCLLQGMGDVPASHGADR